MPSVSEAVRLVLELQNREQTVAGLHEVDAAQSRVTENAVVGAQRRKKVLGELTALERQAVAARGDLANIQRRLVISVIEDEKERRLSALDATLSAERGHVQELLALRVRAKQITVEQARQQQAQIDHLLDKSAERQRALIDRQFQGTAASGRNAQQAMFSLAQGFEDMSYAGGNAGLMLRYAGNNVQQFAIQLAYARQEAAASGRTLKQDFVGSLTGVGGVIAGLALANVAFVATSALINHFAEDADTARDRIRGLVSEILTLNRTPLRLQIEPKNVAGDLAQVEAELERLEAVEARLGGRFRTGLPLGDLVANALGERIDPTELQRQIHALRAHRDNLKGLAAEIEADEFLRPLLERGSGVPRQLIDQATLDAIRDDRARALEEERRAYAQQLEEAGNNAQAREAVQAAHRARLEDINARFDRRDEAAGRRGAAAARREQAARERAAREAEQTARLTAEVQSELFRNARAKEEADIEETARRRRVEAENNARLLGLIEAARVRALGDLETRYERESRDRSEADAARRDRLSAREVEGVAARARAIRETEITILQRRFDLLTEYAREAAKRYGKDSEEFARAANEQYQAAHDLTEYKLGLLEEEREATLALRDRLIEIAEDRYVREATAAARALAAGLRDRERAAALIRRAEYDAEQEILKAALKRLESQRKAEVRENGERSEQARELAGEIAAIEEELAANEQQYFQEVGDAARAAWESRIEAAERAGERIADALIRAATRERRYTDLDVEYQKARYQREEEALKKSLEEREITQAEYDLEIRRLAQERAEFEKAVERDRANFIAESMMSLTELILRELARMAAARVAASIFNIALSFAGPGTIGRARGGAVFGPGTATSDSIVARLSHGEHVWSAAEVAAAGGHAAMERMRRRALFGDLPRFALGGPIRYFPAPPTVPRFARGGGVSMETSGVDLGPLTAEVRGLREQFARLDSTMATYAGRVERVSADPHAARRHRALAEQQDRLSSPRGGTV